MRQDERGTSYVPCAAAAPADGRVTRRVVAQRCRGDALTPVPAMRVGVGRGTHDAATRGRRVMASGDAQKVWFPELIEMVRQAGAPAMSMDALLRLRDRLDTALQTIRRTRQIVPAMMWCSHCQARYRAAPPSVSVRATILALGCFACAMASEVQALEK